MPYENPINQPPEFMRIRPLSAPTPAEATRRSLLAEAANRKLPVEIGTVLDPNMAGNVDDILAEAAKPADPQDTAEYNEREGFGDFFDEHPTLGSALGSIAANGVTKNPDGSYDLRIQSDGENTIHRVTEQGIPTDPQA